jgi:hypothetical protein
MGKQVCHLAERSPMALPGLQIAWHPVKFSSTVPSPAGDRLLAQTVISSGGSLVAHLSRHKANALVAGAGQQVPGLSRLAVQLQGSGFLLTESPSFRLLRQLTSLRYCRSCSTRTWGRAAHASVLQYCHAWR